MVRLKNVFDWFVVESGTISTIVFIAHHLSVIIAIAEHQALVSERLEWLIRSLLEFIPRNLPASHHVQYGTLNNRV